MLRFLLKKNWQVIVFNILLILIFIIGYGRFGDIIVDSFREAYIPQELIAGKVLYRDIFTIYAPFSYLFNALLYSVFGINLKVLYFAGFFTAAGILNLVFFISNKFFPRTYGFGIILFLISAAVLSPNVFNFIFPYSYGILYGLLFILVSILCALNRNFFWAYFMYSLAVCSKYEFILFLPVLIWYSGFKYFFRNIIGLLIPIISVVGILFLQGCRYVDLAVTVQILLSMTKSESLHWFYSVSGLIFRPQLILVYFVELIKLIIPILVLSKYRNKWLIPVCGLYMYSVFSPKLLIYAFPLICLLFLFGFNKLNSRKKFIVISSILISAKVFFALNMQSYGVFFFPFAILSLLILIPKHMKKAFLTVLMLSSIVIGIFHIQQLSGKNTLIKTNKGMIYVPEKYGHSVDNLVKYVTQNTQPEDTVVIYPECLAVNFLADRKSDDKFYSLIPMYVETFGQNTIIKRLEKIKPDVIVLSNYDTSVYKYKFFGSDYAVKVNEYVSDNYNQDSTIGDKFILRIFVRK